MPASLGFLLQAVRSHGRFWSRRVMGSDVFLERIMLVADGEQGGGVETGGGRL